MIKFNIGENFTTITTGVALEGEHLETKVRRIMTNKEPIKDGAPIIYMERSDGIDPRYNVRTDRMEVALESQNSIVKNINAKKDESLKMEKEKAESASKTQGTEQNEKSA